MGDPWHTEDDVELALPAWVEELRPHQEDAIDQVLDAFRRVDHVFLDAPTGAGKTLIAEVVRQRLQTRALYVCSGISLQHQFTRDFDYAKLLKGRSNYATQLMPFPEYNTSDCTKVGEDGTCAFCADAEFCEYQIAKKEAGVADLAVLNTKYFLTVTNHTRAMRGRGLVVMDEADTLEGELMSFTEFRVTKGRLRKLGLVAPKKGVHHKTIAAWLLDELVPAATSARSGQQSFLDKHEKEKERRALLSLIQEARRVARELVPAGEDEDTEAEKNWVRDNNDDGALVLKPVSVAGYGKLLWPHGQKWLLMSATIISSDEMAESLGLTAPYETVTVPMTFPKENREIIRAPVANMANQLKEDEWPKMVRGLQRVLERHPDDRVLVHCVSYALTDYLVGHLDLGDRDVVTYRGSSDRDGALERFRRSDGAVLFAPSFERGIDLVGDECRVVVVAKVPFPNLGDQQVKARLHSKGGQLWYSVATVRSLVQMTGRAVRSVDDYAVTYILDKQFGSNVLAQSKFLLPAWWREALISDFPVRELTR